MLSSRQKFIFLSLSIAVAFPVRATQTSSNIIYPRHYNSLSKSAAFVLPILLSQRFKTAQGTAEQQQPPSLLNSNMTCRSNSSSSASSFMTTSSSGYGSDDSLSSSFDRDIEYPGTSVVRMNNVRARVAQLTQEDLNGSWEDVRRKLLWAGGLKDLPNALPGKGYTGHSFNDYNHVDLTTMAESVSDNENDGLVRGIAIGNRLGEGIRIASIPELGPGGSWTTCSNGCNTNPPEDVAHLQFQSRIAFKLVWVPNDRFDTFVLVDDDGNELARGKPTGQLPSMQQRQMNFRLVKGSKYAKAANAIASNVASE